MTGSRRKLPNSPKQVKMINIVTDKLFSENKGMNLLLVDRK